MNPRNLNSFRLSSELPDSELTNTPMPPIRQMLDDKTGVIPAAWETTAGKAVLISAGVLVLVFVNLKPLKTVKNAYFVLK